jgi:hypothetical protein
MIRSDNGKERSLAILLGASEFPRYAQWSRNSFKRSAFAVEEYFRDPMGLDVKQEDLLNLFDDPGDPSQQLTKIEHFLSERNPDDTSEPPANLLVYYVGHGCFSNDKHHCFALRGTRPTPLGGSALRGGDLAEAIRHGASQLRRFLFIDCCFAAALFSEFQASSPGSVFEAQIDEELPSSGTALLCASSKDLPALAPATWQYTMFGRALIETLRQGDRRMGPLMSLREVEILCRACVRKNSPDSFTRPELHVPKADEGDIANVHVFPNPAWPPHRAALEEQRHNAESEQDSEQVPVYRDPDASNEQQQAKDKAPKVVTERSHMEAEQKAGEAEAQRLVRLEAQHPRETAAQSMPENISHLTANTVLLNDDGFRSFTGDPISEGRASFDSQREAPVLRSRKVVWYLVAGVLLSVSIPAALIGTRLYKSSVDRSAVTTYARDLDASCRNGNAKDCDSLGDLYNSGLMVGFSQDFPKAASYYQKGCDSGNAHACWVLGLFFQNGGNGIHDAQKAAVLFEKACDANLGEFISHNTLAGLQYAAITLFSTSDKSPMRSPTARLVTICRLIFSN